jgi:hypothetical protein
MGTNYTNLLLVYSYTAPITETDSAVVPAIDGHDVCIWAAINDWSYETREKAHTVTRSGTTISWAPAASRPGTTEILVFIYV